MLPEMEMNGRTISILKNKIAQLQIELNEMRPQFGHDFVPMEQVERELTLNIASLKRELRRTLEAQRITAETIQARLQELKSAIQDLKERIRSTAEKRSAYEHLRQEYER